MSASADVGEIDKWLKKATKIGKIGKAEEKCFVTESIEMLSGFIDRVLLDKSLDLDELYSLVLSVRCNIAKEKSKNNRWKFIVGSGSYRFRAVIYNKDQVVESKNFRLPQEAQRFIDIRLVDISGKEWHGVIFDGELLWENIFRHDSIYRMLKRRSGPYTRKVHPREASLGWKMKVRT